MDTLAKNKFADWLYNRFVENYKKSKIIEAFIFLDALSQYQQFVQEIPTMRNQRRHTKQLYQQIIKALKEKKADRLPLAGAEAIDQWNREMQDYEDRLRKMGLSEQYITQKVSDKKMNDNGNELL